MGIIALSNAKSVKGLKYRDHFDYILDKHHLQDKDGFINEVDDLIEGIRPQYNALIRRISGMGNKLAQDTIAIPSTSSNSEIPKIKVWDIGYLYSKFENTKEFEFANIAKEGSYDLTKVICAAQKNFESSTGYVIKECENSNIGNNSDTKHIKWRPCVKKYQLTPKNKDDDDDDDGNKQHPNMYIYLDMFCANEQTAPDDSFQYIHSIDAGHRIPCIAIYLPIVDPRCQTFGSAQITFDEAILVFEMFGKIAYYATFRPEFLPSHHHHKSTKTGAIENPNFKLELFKTTFVNFIYQPNVLRDIVASRHKLTDLNSNKPKDDDGFVQASNELMALNRYKVIIDAMKCLVTWKFAEYLYSNINSKDFGKNQLFRKYYHDLTTKYTLLDYDVNSNEAPFTKNTELLYLTYSCQQPYFELWARLVYANVYHKLKNQNTDTNADVVGEIEGFMNNLCCSVRPSEEKDVNDSSFESQIEVLLGATIQLDIWSYFTQP
ncbi:hypothetical protein H4219_004369 [Mycoemilia scoparia]|uniref:Uncharacterized protein n=1 Tax=Mycoemilia scoparia TaxID=417184 RepID=A0A9W7ZSJ6_9FUNG|nr:hypothetical protein H4219_004369 [Mycoemilia scoparia]